MFGPDEVLTDFSACDPTAWGIVPRAAQQLFEAIEGGPTDSQYLVQCSYIEVYCDTLNDLLGEKKRMPMVLRELQGVNSIGRGVSSLQSRTGQLSMP